MRSVFQKQWFLISLAIVLVIGFVFPHQLGFLAKTKLLRSCIIAGVLFMTSLALETSAIWTAIKRPWATFLAVALNFGLLPIVAWFVANQLLSGPLLLGVLVAAAAPCTMASAAVWTQRAGGNDAVAVMVTVVTNLGCFVMTPLWIAATATSDVSIEVLPMIRKLAWLVVLPMVLGQVLRQNAAIAQWATSQKKRLSIASQFGILFIVFAGAVNCGLELSAQGADRLPWKDFARMILAVSVVHTAVLLVGQFLGSVLGCPREDWIAIGFAGSQKTLPVGIHVASLLGGGLMILPIVAYHVMQLLIDTVVADRLASRSEAGV